METGSLMSIKRNVKDIVIPSEERNIKLYPMNFEEFLWAMGNETLTGIIKSRFEKRRPMGQVMRRKAMDYFRQYLIVSGIPQAAQEYINTRDFDQVDQVKRDILTPYRSNSSRDDRDSRMEIDFLISKGRISSRHNISPLEVKSSKNYTLSSPRKFVVKCGEQLRTPYVIHTEDWRQEDSIVYLPVYMTGLL